MPSEKEAFLFLFIFVPSLVFVKSVMISQLANKSKVSVKGASGKKFFGKNGEILLCAMPRLPVVSCACRPPLSSAQHVKVWWCFTTPFKYTVRAEASAPHVLRRAFFDSFLLCSCAEGVWSLWDKFF